MIRRNGFINPKVIRTVLLLLVSLFSSESFALNNDANRQRWVDSVFHSLSQDQQIKQLLFPITDQDDAMGDMGGIISHHSNDIKAQEASDLTIRGLIPAHLIREELQLETAVLGATDDEKLFTKAGVLSGQQLVGKGFDFLYLPGQFFPEVNEDPVRNHALVTTYLTALGNSGLHSWTEGSRGQAIELLDDLANRGMVLPDVKKKELKTFWRAPANNRLRFYQTNRNDPDLSKAILIADALVFEGDHQYYYDMISALLDGHKMKRKVFDAKVRKVLTYKYAMVKKVPLTGDLNPRKFIREVREKAPVLVQNDNQALPIQHIDNRSFASLSFGVYGTNLFSETLGAYTQFSHFGEPDYLHDAARLKKTLNHYDYVIAGFSFPDDVALENQDAKDRISFLKELSEVTNVIVVVFSEAKWLTEMAELKAVLWVHSREKDFQETAPQIIFGALPATGKLTHRVGEGLPVGHGHQSHSLSRLRYNFPEYVAFDPAMEKKIDFIVSKAIENFATPGCQVLVARKGNVVLNKGYGYFTYDSLREVTKTTIYDLASVTKVVGTLQATMFLQGNGALNLDAALSNYLEELHGTNKEGLKIRDILTHQAGLQSYFPFYKRTYRGDRLNPQYIHLTQESQYNQRISPGLFGHSALEDSVWNWTINSKLRKKPLWKKAYDYTYSDLGFLMMFVLNERLTNQPMEEFLGQNFYDPLGMTSTGYQPTCRFPIHRIAPTERDSDFRNTLIWGMVHDENAAITGGVGGHAGLFSTANDIAKLLQMNLQDGFYGGDHYIPPGTVAGFAKKQYSGNRRGLGWDKPSMGDYQNTARHSSMSTFGHLGFTGTAVWVDPEFDLIYIFLSNRVHPNRHNDKLMVEKIRSRIHEVIYESMPELSGD